MGSIGSFFFCLKKFISDNVAIIVASLALAISIYESIRGRRHDRLSVRPWLKILFNVKDDGETGLLLVNNGVGPGVITKIKVFFDDELVGGEPTNNPWLSIINKFDLRERYNYVNPDTPFWLPAKECIKLFISDYSKKEPDDINSFIKIVKRIKVKVYYQSCYAGKIFPTEKFKSVFYIKPKSNQT